MLYNIVTFALMAWAILHLLCLMGVPPYPPGKVKEAAGVSDMIRSIGVKDVSIRRKKTNLHNRMVKHRKVLYERPV